MSLWTLILRSLRYHLRSHLGVLFGAAVGSAVLIGALLVGDSVRESLREVGMERIGNFGWAMAPNDRFFRDSLSEALGESFSRGSVPGLLTSGTAGTSDGSARANHVQVLGVDQRFWAQAIKRPAFSSIPDDGVILNEPLSAQLKAKVGDTVIIRVPKPSLLSKDAPLTPQDNSSVALRARVHAIVADEEFGRFSLRANQVSPFNAFFNLSRLQKQLGETNQANLLLIPRLENQAASKSPDEMLKAAWAAARGVSLADAELELRELPGRNLLELRTDRVFLDPPVVAAAQRSATNASLVLTYFVNELRAGSRATPYSMVAAMGPPVVPPDVRDDEVVVTRWLADDLRAKAGDLLTIRYFGIGTSRTLEEHTNVFRIHSVVPMDLPYADRDLMPEFPGVTKAESTSDWDGSLPIDMSKIRPQDEKYWKDYRGTPKAFLTLAAGKKIWSNRFGEVTAIRFPVADGDLKTARTQLETNLLAQLNPISLGLQFEPIRSEALAASSQAEDFGGLFIGFSFFLIVAALLLMAMLFQFSIEQRAQEVGTLLALGFTPGKIRRLLLLEGTVLSLIGGLLGMIGAIWYARAMLHALTTVWRDAVAGTELRYHATPETLAMGLGCAILVALGTIWLALRKQARQPARELLADENVEPLPPVGSGAKRNWSGIVGVTSTVFALLTVGWAVFKHDTSSAEMFFTAGSLLLIGAIGLVGAWLTVLARSDASARLTLGGMGVRSATRRRKRSLATVAMLACGSFLIASIGAFRLDENQDSHQRSSGTGGFALIGESTVPVVQDLNSPAGREFFGLDAKTMAGVEMVPLRVRDGDDASCLNLNRAQRPRLLGVKPESLAQRGAFTFAELAKGLPTEHPWLALKAKPSGQGSEPVPAIADEASILWALGKKVGDTLDYTDDRGQVFKVRLVGALANSMLQGNLIIDEAEFARRFPSESGYRMFLIDDSSNRSNEVAAALSKGLRDSGMEVTPSVRRLAAFNAVQNTYLSTFQVLGGLGLLLGSVGLGVVVLRNVLERRGELALLLAVGFRPQALKWLVMSEHGALLLLGLAAGVISAGVAVLPALMSPGSQLPYASLAWTLGGVLVSGLVWTWVATKIALRGRLLDSLRNG